MIPKKIKRSNPHEKEHPRSPRVAYRLVVEYDGGRFQGWQKQGEKQTMQGVRTVTGVMERVLAEANLQVQTLSGSGRTDAGVHAFGQVAHLHLAGAKALKPFELQRVFDEGLPSDVAVRKVSNCSLAFHARHDALERTYLYQIATRRSALAKPYIWWVKGHLDIDVLKKAWISFQGRHTMAAFADIEPDEDARVYMRSCEVTQEGSLVLLRVTGDHFLRRQVRRMVGAAVLCAQGKARLEDLVRDIEHPNAQANQDWASKAAPAAGLFLEYVRYAGDTAPSLNRGFVRMD